MCAPFLQKFHHGGNIVLLLFRERMPPFIENVRRLDFPYGNIPLREYSNILSGEYQLPVVRGEL